MQKRFCGRAQHGGAVVVAVGHVGRRPGHGTALEAADPGHQAVVGVDGRAGEGGQRPAVAQQPADRVVRGVRPAVLGAAEDIQPRVVEALHRIVDVRARAPVAGGGLGHVGDEEALALGDLLQQHPQEHQPVRHPHEVGVAEVELELRVGALGDHVLQPPAEVLEDVDDRAEEAHGVDGVFDVVAEGLASRPHAFAGERIVVEGLTGRPPCQRITMNSGSMPAKPAKPLAAVSCTHA